MSAYCQRQGVSPSTVRFIYDGKRLNDDQTANELDMQDNDIIDALLEQTVYQRSLSNYRVEDWCRNKDRALQIFSNTRTDLHNLSNPTNPF